MPPNSRKYAFPNPFYVLLVLVSTAFAITAINYLISPSIQRFALEHPDRPPSPGWLALAGWLDRRGPLVLGVELTIMMGSGLLAMSTDHWFAARPAPRKPPNAGTDLT
jgi:hypothetical protein